MNLKTEQKMQERKKDIQQYVFRKILNCIRLSESINFLCTENAFNHCKSEMHADEIFII